MLYQIAYLPQVDRHDVPALPKSVRLAVLKAINQKLAVAPHRLGKPLRHRLSGLYSLRVGDYRVIYSIDEQTVVVEAIGHRKDVYEE